MSGKCDTAVTQDALIEMPVSFLLFVDISVTHDFM